MVMKILWTPASSLTPGLIFNLFMKQCAVTFVETNDIDMMVIRFVMDEDASPELNVLIVPADTLFPIQAH